MRRRLLLHGAARALLLALSLIAALAVGGPARAAAAPTPIVFVHGNGDAAAIWLTTIWRFESNGWPRDRLFAIDLTNPTATAVYNVPSPGRSTTDEVKDQLAGYVDDVLARTGAKKVFLLGNSRGANTIRNYVKNGGGKAKVAGVVLGGGVNHGVIRSDTLLAGSEFNGKSAFIEQLNAGPNEVVAGVPFLTIRSDRHDLYAQPTAKYLLGQPDLSTGISYDAPALKGAVNRVLTGVDHRETSFTSASFRLAYRFLTGRMPRTGEIADERGPVLDGTVTGVTGGFYNNTAVAGASLAIYEVNRNTGARLGGPAWQVTTKADGRFGPFRARRAAYYEFELKVPGSPTTHIYRTPFARGSSVITLRPAMSADPARSDVRMSRPRGYFDAKRDYVLLAGKRPAAIPDDPVPTVSLVSYLDGKVGQPVQGVFNQETITARAPAVGEVAIIELTY